MYEGLPQAIAPTSSRSAFLGKDLPFAASAIEHFSQNIEDYLSTAVQEALEVLQDRLRMSLASIPEWAEYAESVSVEWDGDSFQYVFTGSDDDIEAMRELEYGFSEDSSAKSVTRKTAMEMEDRAGKLISDILNREVGLGR